MWLEVVIDSFKLTLTDTMSTKTEQDIVDSIPFNLRLSYLVYGYIKETENCFKLVLIPNEIKDLCKAFMSDHRIKSETEIQRIRNKWRYIVIQYNIFYPPSIII